MNTLLFKMSLITLYIFLFFNARQPVVFSNMMYLDVGYLFRYFSLKMHVGYLRMDFYCRIVNCDQYVNDLHPDGG